MGGELFLSHGNNLCSKIFDGRIFMNIFRENYYTMKTLNRISESDVNKVIRREELNGYKLISKKNEIPITAIGCDTAIEVFYTLVFEKK